MLAHRRGARVRQAVRLPQGETVGEDVDGGDPVAQVQTRLRPRHRELAGTAVLVEVVEILRAHRHVGDAIGAALNLM